VLGAHDDEMAGRGGLEGGLRRPRLTGYESAAQAR